MSTSEDSMQDTIVDPVVQRTVDWANAMREWLNAYNEHIEALCNEKRIPKPPPW